MCILVSLTIEFVSFQVFVSIIINLEYFFFYDILGPKRKYEFFFSLENESNIYLNSQFVHAVSTDYTSVGNVVPSILDKIDGLDDHRRAFSPYQGLVFLYISFVHFSQYHQ